ncbi:peptidase inhibitor 16 isoform X1 [Teleopsis dalmanni]|uniref:peptidase inhibitor 16 isoform X1 n=1 Tax=Teleopsis dalmanni TaxID=139649 RepID=UPI0018CD5C90|nr:peptidase inhibitor 16 isoform X1 [Teleopsis dalmanni]
MSHKGPEKYFLHIILVLISCSAALACQGKLLVTGITEEEKRVILQEHNRLRQLVATGRYPGQPAAENMREIVWDDELAARAQKWAENCQFRHDPLRTINRFTMGQNLAIIWSTAPLAPDDGDFPSRIQSWFNEVQKYSFGDAWSPKTGHYSQLVWGETSLVGCGFAEYKDSVKYNKLYVCNYGPGGNVVGYNPYEVGKPSCASYGMRPSSRYQGLCAAPNAASNGLTTNTIETYEFNQNNAYNNKQTAYSTHYPQPASSSYTQQAPAFDDPSTSLSDGISSGDPDTGSQAYNSGASYATEANQYKYKNKLEAYKPTAEEFQKSVLKHTILRTFIKQNNQPFPFPTSANNQQESETYVIQEQTESNTPKPAKKGWSLLTWRG